MGRFVIVHCQYGNKLHNDDTKESKNKYFFITLIHHPLDGYNTSFELLLTLINSYTTSLEKVS